MGTNKRYASAVDSRMDARIAERIMRSGAPQSLTPAELDLSGLPLTRDPTPAPVHEWVRYPDSVIEVDAVAVAWTSCAIALRWKGPNDEEYRAWVWAGECRESEPRGASRLAQNIIEAQPRRLGSSTGATVQMTTLICRAAAP